MPTTASGFKSPGANQCCHQQGCSNCATPASTPAHTLCTPAALFVQAHARHRGRLCAGSSRNPHLGRWVGNRPGLERYPYVLPQVSCLNAATARRWIGPLLCCLKSGSNLRLLLLSHPPSTNTPAAAITLLLFLLAASNGQLHTMHWCALPAVQGCCDHLCWG